jgi:hypothetical protein
MRREAATVSIIPWAKVSGVLAVLCVILGAMLAVQGVRVDAAEARRDLAELDVRRVVEANGAAAGVVDRLQAELLACAGEREALLSRFRFAEETARTERERIQRELAARTRELRSIYERDQDAAAWAAVPVPGAVSDSLQAGHSGAP